MNCGPLFEMMELGRPLHFQTGVRNMAVTFVVLAVVSQEIKCLIVVILSTPTNIASNP